MELIVYLLPFIFSIGLIIFFWKYMVWWEYLLFIGISLLVAFVFKCAIDFGSCRDDKYVGGYITKITHYDEWDEWIHRTCTRKVGKITTSYDCSYREVHPEQWMYTDNRGIEHYFLGKKQFDKAMRELGNPKMVFRDMNRNYYHIDGDAQDYYYDKKVNHIRSLTSRETYTNKVLSSNSIFNFEEIDEDEAKKLGLFDYPKIEEDDQKTILGKYFAPSTVKKFNYINSVYGPPRQFRVYILVFNGKPYDISEKQRSYWKRGNDNELVVCLGYDEKKNSITWCNAFSWSDSPSLEVATERFFREHNRIVDVDQYGDWLVKNLNLWRKKDFKDFDYLSGELPVAGLIFLLVLTILLDIGLSILFVRNDYTNEGLLKSKSLRNIINKTKTLFLKLRSKCKF